MFHTKEELIERIMTAPGWVGGIAPVVIQSILEEMQGYQLARIARKVRPHWTDEIKYDKDLCRTDYLREHVKGEDYRCTACGYQNHISSVYAHSTDCKVLIALSKKCVSKEEFFDRLRAKFDPQKRLIRKLIG